MKQVSLYIDPASHHFMEDRLFVLNDGRLNGDRINAPYVHLRDYLAARGVEVHTADRLPARVRNGSHHVYVSMGMFENYAKLEPRGDTILSAFFAMECPIVDPSLYRELNRAQEVFKRIFSWSDSRSLERFVGGPLRCEHFCWPQSFDDVHEGIWQNDERLFMVMINSNKLPLVYWQELYSERIRAVEFFSRTNDIDLYGKGWSEPAFPMYRKWMPWTVRWAHHAVKRWWDGLRPDPLLKAAQRAYRGTVASKAETLGRYRFALCFENMILKGWITEKIFDCFFAGAVPIYWGAPDIQDRVPADCFIDMRKFSGYPELREFLKSLSPADIGRYKAAAREFILSPRFYPFSKQAFAERFARIIAEDTGISL